MTIQLLELNLHQHKNFTTNPLLICATNTLVIGTVSAINRDNNSFIIDSIPDNVFSVRLLNADNTVSTTINNYVLQLHFEKI